MIEKSIKDIKSITCEIKINKDNNESIIWCSLMRRERTTLDGVTPASIELDDNFDFVRINETAIKNIAIVVGELFTADREGNGISIDLKEDSQCEIHESEVYNVIKKTLICE